MPRPCSFCQLDPCRVDRTKERRRERMDECQTPHRGPETPTAEESGSSVHEGPSSEPAAVAPVGASASPAETVPAPSGSNGSTHGPSVGRDYEAPGPEAAQPNGDAPAPTATAED